MIILIALGSREMTVGILIGYTKARLAELALFAEAAA